MVRRNSAAIQNDDLDDARWTQHYFRERHRDPWWLSVSVPEPFRVGDRVSVEGHPNVDARDFQERFLDSRYRHGYELPITLVDEALSRNDALQLSTALSLVRQLQGLDSREGLAFLCHLHIFLVDWLRAKDGKESILRGPTWNQLELSSGSTSKERRTEAFHPFFRVRSLRATWHAVGGRVGRGYLKNVDPSPGRPTYLTIPAMWLPVDVLQALPNVGNGPHQVPVLADAEYAPLVEQFESFRRHLERGGGTVMISFGNSCPAPEQVPDKRRGTFRRSGNGWILGYEGTSFHMGNTKGIQYIAYLLAEPRRQFHVLDLTAIVDHHSDFSMGHRQRSIAANSLDELGMHDSRFGAVMPLLDQTSKDEYRRRLTEIASDLDEAREHGHVLTVEQLQEERDTILEELRRATGLGGRDRSAPSPEERARTRVRKQIKAVLDRLSKHHLPLSQHLQNSIKTGYLCSYEPDQDVEWTL